MPRDDDPDRSETWGGAPASTNASQEGWGDAVPPPPGFPSQQPGVPGGPEESAGHAPPPGEGSLGQAPGPSRSRGGGDSWFSRLLRIFRGG